MIAAAEVLRAAKARIVEKGWGQGYENCGIPRGCKTECAGVAIDRAYAESDLTLMYCQVNDPFRAAIGDRNILAWNDAPGRTQAEVLAAFDKAIQLADAATSRDAAGMK